MIKSLLSKLLVAKVLAGTTAAVAVGGLALTATDGHLPGPLYRGTAHTTTTSAAGHRVAPAGTKAPTWFSEASRRTPSKVLLGHLCRFWLVAPAPNQDMLLRSRFAKVLVKAAGGEKNVQSYCVGLVGEPPPCPSMTVRPIPSGSPAARSEARDWTRWPDDWPSAQDGRSARTTTPTVRTTRTGTETTRDLRDWSAWPELFWSCAAKAGWDGYHASGSQPTWSHPTVTWPHPTVTWTAPPSVPSTGGFRTGSGGHSYGYGHGGYVLPTRTAVPTLTATEGAVSGSH